MILLTNSRGKPVAISIHSLHFAERFRDGATVTYSTGGKAKTVNVKESPEAIAKRVAIMTGLVD